MLVGIDIGSTTVKVVVLDKDKQIVHTAYERHYAKVREKATDMLINVRHLLSKEPIQVTITGSAGLGVAKSSGMGFVQEVYACAGAVEKFYPETDCVVELGGEDAKIIFFGGAIEERMNGSCAGGTGAFIDQMATLMDVTVQELDALSSQHTQIYPIASRCGVFAKTDIQPLLNQGANKADIAASVFQAVVDQTVAGLAQGRRITGQVVFLGGPLFFLKGLRERFVETLSLDRSIFPQNGDCFVGIGAALLAADQSPMVYDEVVKRLRDSQETMETTLHRKPLFASQEDYAAFVSRHSSVTVPKVDINTYSGDAYLGIDAGSTTTKLALITPQGALLYQYYAGNLGNPVRVVKEQLQLIYQLIGSRICLRGNAVTGYGEELIGQAFCLDAGLVETVAHLKAAQHFNPDVDFILDIGGQDMKCFKIRQGIVDSIMLNEACSSGCGSFLETFAKALGYSIADFAQLGLMAEAPVDLGSRCTVFMNSAVKQAQKEGATVADISAGLSSSVVKNVIYKVIRAPQADALGQHIVVQGGTFLNDAVLRAFEQELGRQVTRPAIAGLMGAFGAALHAMSLSLDRSALLTAEALDTLQYTSKPSLCQLCTNRCHMTVNRFDERTFISGNRCERGAGKPKSSPIPNLFRWKYEYLFSLPRKAQGAPRGNIGIPVGLNMYENLPFWLAFLTEMGFDVTLSPKTTRELYNLGQFTIPSDTVCYPAKLLHGHIEALLDAGVDTIFYPCLPYNFDEGQGDSHYNCPVVAYYPELLGANVTRLQDVRYLTPYVGLHRPKDFKKKSMEYWGLTMGVDPATVTKAVAAAYRAHETYQSALRQEGERLVSFARANGHKMLVLAGRPYHIDPEVSHGIDELITSFGLCVLTEDAVAHLATKQPVKVLNQWTYHARLYNAARYVVTQPDMHFIQLVSFGCGLDAITGDECRDILETGGKLYTQIKIDEISNLGAVKIRIRSLLSTIQN